MHFELQKMVSEVLDLNNEFLSSREMNRVKRKAKQVSTRQMYEESANNASASGDTDMKVFEIRDMAEKRIKLEDNDSLKSSTSIIDEVFVMIHMIAFLISFYRF